MIRRPPRSTQSRSSAASDVYKRQIKRRIGIDMEHRGKASVIGPVHGGVNAERAFLEAPELPHRHVAANLAVGLDGDLLRQLEQVPDLVHPGTDAYHHGLASDAALVGVERRDRARVRAELE